MLGIFLSRPLSIYLYICIPKIVVACVTSNYYKSENCKREIQFVDTTNKPIIPVLLDTPEWPPPDGPFRPVLARRDHIKFTETGNDFFSNKEFDTLLDQIRNAIGQPSNAHLAEAVQSCNDDTYDGDGSETPDRDCQSETERVTTQIEMVEEGSKATLSKANANTTALHSPQSTCCVIQ